MSYSLGHIDYSELQAYSLLIEGFIFFASKLGTPVCVSRLTPQRSPQKTIKQNIHEMGHFSHGQNENLYKHSHSIF